MNKAAKIILCLLLVAGAAVSFFLAYMLFGMAHYILSDGSSDYLQKFGGERMTWHHTLEYLSGLFYFSLPVFLQHCPGVLSAFFTFRVGLSLKPKLRHQSTADKLTSVS